MTQQNSLFRQEVGQFLRDRQWGGVVLLQPLSISALAWGMVVGVGLIIGFLFAAQYARKETVTGYLAPTAGVVKIFSPRPGIIQALHVSEGDIVQAGQPLATIAMDQTSADGENVDATVWKALDGQRRRLIEQVAMEEAQARSEKLRLEAQVAGIDGEVAQLSSQIAVQQERIDNLVELASTGESLRAKGYISAIEFRQRRENLLAQKQNLGALGQQKMERESARTSARFSLQQLPAVTAGKIQTLRHQIAEVEQRMAEIQGRRATIVQAPVAGRIATVQALVGRTTDPQKMLLSVLPTDSLLQAELFVPTRAVGFIRPGHEVRILYDAYPYQRFGTHRGKVVRVSQTILTSADLSAPVPLNDPSYKVTVALDAQDINVSGERQPLQADMLLHADIILDRRPLILWLLNPLLGTRFQ
jgi:membrane fusion protein